MWSLVDIWAPGETQRGAELSRQNAELNARRVAMGKETPEWAAAQSEAFDANGPDTYNQQIADAAAQGALEGFAAMPEKARGLFNGAAGWSLSFFPWWAWLLAGLAVFAWLGGAELSRGILARK